MPYSKCKCQSTHAAVETFLGSQAAALWRFSSSCYHRRKEAPFVVPWAPFPKQLSVPHVLASSFTIRNTFPSLPSVHVCSASCQSKTSSCFPVPCGLCMPSLVLPAFSSPKRQKPWHWGPEVVLSRAVDALPRRASLTSVSCWVSSPAALRLWSLTLAWPSRASCLTPALFQRQNPRSCCRFKAFVILCRSVTVPGGWGQPERDAALQLPQGSRCNLSPARSGLVCGRTAARAACRWWHVPTGICLTNTHLASWEGKGFLGGKVLGRSRHASCFLSSKLSGSIATLKGYGQSQADTACRKQIPNLCTWLLEPSRDAEVHLEPRWLQTSRTANAQSRPPCWGWAGRAAVPALRVLHEQPHTQWPIPFSQKAALAVPELLPEQHEAEPWQSRRHKGPVLLTPASERAV